MGGDGGWVTEGKNKGNQGIRVNQTRIKNNEEELRKEKRKEEDAGGCRKREQREVLQHRAGSCSLHQHDLHNYTERALIGENSNYSVLFHGTL